MVSIFPNPKNCSGQEEMVNRYLDGELSPLEQEGFQPHLQRCLACQALLAELETVFADLVALEEITAPGRIVEGVMAGLPGESWPESRPRSFDLGQWVLAGQIAIGLGLGLMLLPVGISTFNSQALGMSWLTLASLFRSQAGWLSELLKDFSQWGQIWLEAGVTSINLNISPGLATGLVVGLGLAWLLGNGVLLRNYSSPTRNGGV